MVTRELAKSTPVETSAVPPILERCTHRRYHEEQHTAGTAHEMPMHEEGTGDAMRDAPRESPADREDDVHLARGRQRSRAVVAWGDRSLI